MTNFAVPFQVQRSDLDSTAMIDDIVSDGAVFQACLTAQCQGSSVGIIGVFVDI